MDKFGLGFLNSLKDARDQAESASSYYNQGGQFSKEKARQFLAAVLTQLKSNDTSPISKVLTLHVLKQLTYQAENKFFSALSSDPTLQFLQSQALNVDPKKSMSEKGSKKFPGQPELGKQYMRVLLELVNFWGQKFAKGKNSDPTKFRKNLTELKNNSVTMPTGNEYFDPNQFKNRIRKGKQGGSNTSNMMNSSKQIPGGSRPGGKISNELKFTKERINIFIDDLDEAEDVNKIQNLIQSNHSFFDKEKTKYDSRGAQAQQDEEALADYFTVQHFLTEEGISYSQHIPVNDYQSYISQIKILQENTFDKKASAPRGVGQKVEYKIPITTSSPYSNAGTRASPINSGITGVTDSKALISNLYSRLDQRSKSPGGGFKSVQKQLQKEKELAKRNPPRKSKSPRNFNKSDFKTSNASNLRELSINPIFDNPPNNYVSPKNYEGQIIMQNRDLTRVLFNLKKDQGPRRFKISNFRQKNPLFQNEQIQVGYKSQPVYENINDFNHLILLNIYIGNKTDDGIKDFQVDYKGDSNQLLYANPRTIDSIIPAGYQNKHDLLITPLSVPYCLMTMNISYKFKGVSIFASIVLPNSVLKFASYMKITSYDFDNNWRNARKFRTNPFRLCKYLSPDSLNKWIPTLDFKTQYSQFSRQGSQTDLEMFCLVIMLQKYQAVLKINIRPNLEVILQLGVLDDNQEGLKYFKFYLQTLELVLKEIDM